MVRSDICRSASAPLPTLLARDNMHTMKINSITANRNIFDGKVNGKPEPLQFAFDGGSTMRLGVAGDGERMILDDGPLHEPCDLGECGQLDIVDVTQTLFPTCAAVEVADIEALTLYGRLVGVKLNVAGGEPFHVWVYGDELHWGDGAALAGYDWLDRVAPAPSGRLEV